MRKRTKQRPNETVIYQQLVPDSEWTKDGEIAGWQLETQCRETAELLADITSFSDASGRGFWFQDDADRTVALLCDEGVNIPAEMMTRLKRCRPVLEVWWSKHGKASVQSVEAH